MKNSINIEVSNIYYNCRGNVYDVFIDRSSILGNPYYMYKETQRNEVCDKYEIWLNNQIKNKEPKIINELNRIFNILKKYNKVRLLCYCAPKRCHGDYIKTLLLKRIENNSINELF